MEQRLADLEAQIERLNVTLLRWRETEPPRESIDPQHAQLTSQLTDILKQWTAASERHAEVVGDLETRLAGWSDIETRLQRDATWRFQGLERTIEREWAAIRLLHEAPVRQLAEQAESLTEICVNTAGSTQTGIERAEARLSALETDIHRRIDDLSRDLRAVLSELRQHGNPARRGAASAWPLDEVMRLHEELRDGAAVDENHANVVEPRVLEASTTTSEAATEPTRLESRGPARVVTPSEPVDIAHQEAEEPAQGDRSAWKWLAAVAALAVAVAVVAGLAWSFYRQATVAAERASEAQQHAQQIASTANERIEAARQDAAAQITLAHDAASKAQVTGDVLAASDLVRFNLVGGDPAARTLAQLLWSRSRGLVFSASRMPPPPQGFVYQLWLLTAGAPIGLGTVAPDASGRVTLATDNPPDAPRPIVGVRVTIEPAPGRPAPSGPVALAPVVVAPPQ